MVSIIFRLVTLLLLVIRFILWSLSISRLSSLLWCRFRSSLQMVLYLWFGVYSHLIHLLIRLVNVILLRLVFSLFSCWRILSAGFLRNGLSFRICYTLPVVPGISVLETILGHCKVFMIGFKMFYFWSSKFFHSFYRFFFWYLFFFYWDYYFLYKLVLSSFCSNVWALSLVFFV